MSERPNAPEPDALTAEEVEAVRAMIAERRAIPDLPPPFGVLTLVIGSMNPGEPDDEPEGAAP